MSYQQGSVFAELEQLSDESLCAEIHAGNRDAEEVLAARCHRLVRRISRPYFLTGGESEDLLQEGMFGLINAMREYDPTRDAAFSTFAEHCIRNRLCSVLRAAGNHKNAPLNEAVPLNPSFFEANRSFAQDDPEEALIGQEKADLLLKTACQQLSAFEVEILGHYLTGLTCREIAETVGKPAKSVENAVQRIRRKLAKQISSGDIS